MNLMSKVIVSYHIRAGRFGESSSFDSTKELEKIIKHATYQQPYDLKIGSTVQIIDTDIKPKESDYGSVFYPTFKNPTVVAEIPDDNESFIISDKLTYPKDVSEHLIKKYGSVLDFDETKFKADVPVSFKGVKESMRIGLPNPKTGMPTTYIHQGVICTPLNANNIVLDSNLNQLWPEKTGEKPAALTKILNKKVATDLLSRVVFCVDILGKQKFIASMQDLQEFIQKANYQKPYYKKLTRIVQIVYKSLVHAEIPADNKTFIIADKITYPKDVSEYLKKEYGSVLDFDETKFKADLPVLFKISEEKCTDSSGVVFHTLHRVICTPLNKMNIVLDSNLNQLWPENTGKMSSVLVDIFAKNKEEIRQG